MRKSSFLPSQINSDDIIRLKLEGGKIVSTSGAELASSTDDNDTISFRYSPESTGLKSTQQLDIDWSKFENHTFFNSAAAKTSVAFDKIINKFPFDGTEQEVNAFLDALTGFEKHVLDSFPTSTGALLFDGTNFVSVRDFTGGDHDAIFSKDSGAPALNPTGSFALEFHINVPASANTTQIIAQKSKASDSLTCFLSASSSPSIATIGLEYVAGGKTGRVYGQIPKGSDEHVGLIRNASGVLGFYHSGQIVTGSLVESGLDTSGAPLLIGSGTTFSVNGVASTPTATLSGVVDEFRLWHEPRTAEQLSLTAERGVYGTPALALNFRFNEPSDYFVSQDSVAPNSLLLDYSGKGHHSNVSNFAFSQRVSGTLANESSRSNPVLFPAFSGVSSLNASLLGAATLFDEVNPNLITKLVPPHMLALGKLQDGQSGEFGAITDPFTGEGPRKSRLGSTQILLSILFFWAKYFDEIKLFTDAFSAVRNTELGADAPTPSVFLVDALNDLGFNINDFFADANLSQYVDGLGVLDDGSVAEKSLQSIKTELLRRLLFNIDDIISSKGTIHSIKAYFRSIGIDPDTSFRVREYGGATEKSLDGRRSTHVKEIKELQLLGGQVTSQFLSESRTQPGAPLIAGSFVPFGSGFISNNVNDGLSLSGSWTVEANVRFASGSSQNSVARLYSTGSNGRILLANLVSSGSQLHLFVSPQSGSIIQQTLDVNINDGQLWNLSFGRRRDDLTLSDYAAVSSSFFVRAVQYSEGDLAAQKEAFQIYSRTPSADFFSNKSSANNASGCFLQVGTDTATISNTMGLGTPAALPTAKYVSTTGSLARVAVWGRELSAEEWSEHSKNIFSYGSSNPLTGFVNGDQSGSFQNLKFELTSDQDEVAADGGGNVSLYRFPQAVTTGTGFAPSTTVFSSHIVHDSLLEHSYDESVDENKVRVRSYEDAENLASAKFAAASLAPVYSIPKSESPVDDSRLSIDISISDGVDKDIFKMFGGLTSLDDSLGHRISSQEESYPALDQLRKIHASRFVSDLDLQAFFYFYRWLDGNIGHFVDQLIPAKTRYLGMRYVIRSHALERFRMKYYDEEAFLPAERRQNLDGSILLESVAGIVRRY